MRIKTGNGWPHDVSKQDLKITHIRGSGAGGQHRNKTSSGVLIIHLPTGIQARSTEHREQPLNLKSAFRKLTTQLIPLMKKEAVVERYKSGFDRVRTYHQPDNRVTDIRLGVCGSYDEVIHGSKFQEIVEQLLINKEN